MTPRFRSAREAEDYLLGFVNYELRSRYRRDTRSHDLKLFGARLAEMGWDPAAVATVHVAGTNAKGTVATLLERVLRAGGLHTGLYTSPHLHAMRERVRLDGRPLSASAFREGVERIAGRFAAAPGAGFRTTFEHLTALALLSFQESGVERAVVEVGLGGRLDATNVLAAGPVVFTPISVDHAQVLGRTVGAIAADKARILKRGGTGFVMPQSPPAWAAIRRRARAVGAPLVATADAVAVREVRVGPKGTVFDLAGREDHGRVATRLLGAHQVRNLAAVVAVAETLLDAPAARRAVRDGLAGAVVPGRLEVLGHRGRRYLLDGGHNPAAGAAVAAALRRHFPDATITAVVGMAGDKAHAAYLRPLAPLVSRFIFTAADNPRAADPARLAAKLGGRAETSIPVGEALARARRGPADLILVAGSFLVVAEAREALGRRTS